MPLAVQPPVAPMLAKLAPDLPTGDYAFEPKWDGFRCLAFRDGDHVDLRSRHDSALGRYFPELVTALLAVDERRFVLDGEIVVLTERGFDFDALLKRIHPAARHVESMLRTTRAAFIAFDALQVGDDDLREQPFAERRLRLEAMLHGVDRPLYVTPLARTEASARRWLDDLPPGTDGVVAKHLDLPYRPGKRAMVKVKPHRTADCVVAGFRLLAGQPAVSSLLLGLYDDRDTLRHVGVVASFTGARRTALIEELRPFITSLTDHPWREGFALEGGSMGRLKGSAGRWTPDLPLDWVPLRPELVCEAAYDQVDDDRWRHPGRFVRWRPDRDAHSCRLDQLRRA